jgi:hypothetical protein
MPSSPETSERLKQIKAVIRQLERGEAKGFPTTEETLKRLQQEIIDLGGEPWCNHDAAAVVDGVCECEVRVTPSEFGA